MIDKILSTFDSLLVRWRPLLRRRSLRLKMERSRLRSPDKFAPIDSEVERQHLNIWRRIEPNPLLDWVRLFTNLSGIPDPRYCPEDIYHSRIECVLNDRERRGFECEDKNDFYNYIDRKYAPKVVLRYIRGMFMDEEFNAFSAEEAERRLCVDRGRLIGKVACGSLGGYGVEIFNFQDGRYCRRNGEPLTADFITRAGSYVIQERVDQCDFTAQFNPSSCNTFRMITLRCPWDGKIVLLKTGFRIGVSNLPVDNLSSGGICVLVDQNGKLNDCAYNYMTKVPYGRYDEHPTTHVRFKGKSHPNFGVMKKAVLESAIRIPNDNILAWDVVATKSGEIKFLEVNAYSIGIDWMQYAFGSLFGDLTEKVIDWCVTHRELNYERIIRFG